MKYPLVLDLAADGVPVAVTCRVLGFSKQAFYAWCQNPVSQRDSTSRHYATTLRVSCSRVASICVILPRALATAMAEQQRCVITPIPF
jgi:hypothetical protein